MKRIFKYILSSALPVFLIGTTQAQITALDTVCRGETVCVTTTSFNGTIQWQSSADASAWTDVVGATNDTACFVLNSNTYYRGVISENTCDPIFTDTSYFMVHNFDRITTFNFTGAMQTFTVPADACDTLFIQCWGAQAGSGAVGGAGTTGGNGGLGGYVEGFLLVNPGDVLNIFVGGMGATPTGGFNGGANGGSANAGGGGGASDVRVGGTAEANRIITAGGGGGGGRGGCHEGAGTGGNGGNGGFGGGGVGTDGADSPTSGGVAGGGKGGNFGGVQGALGATGVGCGGFLGAPGFATATGTGGVGGNGQTCCCSSQPSVVGGGGGGGGQIGGGGGGGGSAGTTGCSGNSKGAGGGGGGGSSFIGGVINGVAVNGIWSGNGQVTISY